MSTSSNAILRDDGQLTRWPVVCAVRDVSQNYTLFDVFEFLKAVSKQLKEIGVNYIVFQSFFKLPTLRMS